MIDYLRENLSYIGLYCRIRKAVKEMDPVQVSYGNDSDQYFLYYEPNSKASDTVIFWIHGGGWHGGSPLSYDYVCQRMADEGYRVVSFGYRLSPKNKYPAQIEDICACYNAALSYLRERQIDASKIIVVGPSAGAHLASILCYSKKDQQKYGVDISPIAGFVGFGGPYSFRKDQTKTMACLEWMLFEKGYDRKGAEPVSLISKNYIPMLLIQSRHDGLIEYNCALDFEKRAKEIGNSCEIYSVTDKKNTHSWYCMGSFLFKRSENATQDKIFSWIEEAGR